MSKEESDKKRRIGSGIGIAVLSIAIVGVIVFSEPKSNATLTATNPVPKGSSSTTAKTTSSAANSGSYKNGTYMATGTYYSPGGKESVKVSLTLSNDVVTASNVVSGANDPTAISYQTIFIGNYKKYVVGKKINSIKLSNVSGSSLTSQGFKNALQQIEQQAKA
jgi:uncharacterized protein with FMN-binding domain